MNVLIVNDDGIESEGLRVLAERVGKNHDVYVLAPDSNRSAASHHILMFHDLELIQHKKNWWGCSGMPADCTCVALRSGLFDVDFDVVLSGINDGANMGTDIVYSGTCAGARQAVLSGVPGIAVSLFPDGPHGWNGEGAKYIALADFVSDNLETLAEMSAEKYPGTFVNINAASRDSYKGVRIANRLQVRHYNEDIRIERTSNGVFSHFNPRDDGPSACDSGTDFDYARSGYIVLSMVHAQPLAANVVDGISFKV